MALELVLVAGLVDDRCAAAWCAAAAGGGARAFLAPRPLFWRPDLQSRPPSHRPVTHHREHQEWAVSDRPPSSSHNKFQVGQLGLKSSHESRTMNLSLSSSVMEQEKSHQQQQQQQPPQGMNLLLLQQMYQPVLSGLFFSQYHTLQNVNSWLCSPIYACSSIMQEKIECKISFANERNSQSANRFLG